MVLGGWGEDGSLDSVEMLDMETGAWRQGPPLPKARYGHTCLLTEVAGTRGVMVAGGALTGNEVVFLDLETMEWRDLPSLNYKIGEVQAQVKSHYLYLHLSRRPQADIGRGHPNLIQLGEYRAI